MARTPKSEEEKQKRRDDIRKAREEKFKVPQKIDQFVGRTRWVETRRPDWRITSDRRTSLFLTFSNFYEASDKTWYDINQNDLNLWKSYPRAFVIFVMGDSAHCLVIPVSTSETLLKGLVPASDGTYKLLIKERSGRYAFIEQPRLDLAPFENMFGLLSA
jgi:hypothetical protein